MRSCTIQPVCGTSDTVERMCEEALSTEEREKSGTDRSVCERVSSDSHGAFPSAAVPSSVFPPHLGSDPLFLGAAEEECQLEQYNVAQQNGNAAAEYVTVPSALPAWLSFLLRLRCFPLLARELAFHFTSVFVSI